EDDAAERLPAHLAAEDEHRRRDAEAIQDQDLQVEDAEEDDQGRADVRPGDDGESLADGDQPRGGPGGQEDGDGWGARHADPGQQAEQAAAPDPVGEAGDQAAELPAAGLLEVVADEVQADEEQAKPGHQEGNDFGHGGPYLDSAPVRGKIMLVASSLMPLN